MSRPEINGLNMLRGSHIMRDPICHNPVNREGDGMEAGPKWNTFCDGRSHYNLWRNKFKRLFVKMYAVIFRCT